MAVAAAEVVEPAALGAAVLGTADAAEVGADALVTLWAETVVEIDDVLVEGATDFDEAQPAASASPTMSPPTSRTTCLTTCLTTWSLPRARAGREPTLTPRPIGLA